MAKRWATRVTLALVAAGAAAAVIAIALWAASGTGGPVEASHGSLAVGVDVDTAGNTATLVDLTPETCRTVSVGTIFDVDVYVTEVVDLASWGAYLRFNKDVLTVTGHALMFQGAQPNSNVIDDSGPTPNTAGLYRIGGADISATTPGSGDDGDGVLVRVTLQAIANGAGDLSVRPVDINGDTLYDDAHDVGPWLKADVGTLINDTSPVNGFFDGPVNDGGVNVGPGLDTDGDTLLNACDPDDDNDGICDIGGPLPDGTAGTPPGGCSVAPSGADNCPVNATVSQTNTYGELPGNTCDPDDDNDAICDTGGPLPNGTPGTPPGGCSAGASGVDNCPIVGNLSQANFDGDSLGDACDPDDDNDAVNDVTDNCQFVANGPAQSGVPGVGNQTNSDGQGDGGNACDTDDDDDGFIDTLEQYLATDQADKCANTGTPGDESNDRWSADFDDDQWLGIGDFNSFTFPLRPDGSFAKFGHSLPDPQDPNLQRWDLDPTGTISIGDLNAISPSVNAPTARPPMLGGQAAFGRTCAP